MFPENHITSRLMIALALALVFINELFGSAPPQS
jgi:hypothetical protein